jgi:TonB family protein
VPGSTPAGVVRQGELVRRVDPAYPAQARDRHVEGMVRLNATIGTDGAVRTVSLLGGPPLLVGAAEKAVLQWRYAPTVLDGKPVEVQKEVDLRFHFTEPAH